MLGRIRTAFLLLSLSVTEALGEPITIFGINWSIEPIESAIKDQGYTCSDEELAWSGTLRVCNFGEKRIEVSKDKLSFSCEVFNGCGFKLEEVSQSLVDSGVIGNLEYGVLNYYENSGNGWIDSLYQYCGRGPEGDVICVSDYKFPKREVKIDLLRAQYGSGELNFN